MRFHCDAALLAGVTRALERVAAPAGLAVCLWAQSAAVQCYTFPNAPPACVANPTPPTCDASCRQGRQFAADAQRAQREAEAQREEAAYKQTWDQARQAFVDHDYPAALKFYQAALAQRGGPSVRANIDLVQALMVWNSDPKLALQHLLERRRYLAQYHDAQSDTLIASNEAEIQKLQGYVARSQAAQEGLAEVTQMRRAYIADAQATQIAAAQSRADARLAAWKAQPPTADPAVLQGKRDAVGLMTTSGGVAGAFGVRETGQANVGQARSNQTQTYANTSAQLGGAAGSASDINTGAAQGSEGIKAASDCVFTGGGAPCHASAPLPLVHTDPQHFAADDLAQKLGPQVAGNAAVKAALGAYRQAEVVAQAKADDLADAEKALTPKSPHEQRVYVEGLKLQLKRDRQTEATALGQVKAKVLDLGVAMP